MMFGTLIQAAIDAACEELEASKIINNVRLNTNPVLEHECVVCFDKFFSNNLKLLSCNKHHSCNECWNNYVKSRLELNIDSDTCFICFPRDRLLNISEDDDNLINNIFDIEPPLDYVVMNNVIPYNLLNINKYLINTSNYNNLFVSIYQADFKYINTNENDVIINLVNNKYMFHKYGLALTLYNKACHTFGAESLNWVKENGVMSKNSVVITNGGFIKGKIIHCNSPNPAGKSLIALNHSLNTCYTNVFEKILTMNNTKRIFLPGIFARRVEDYDDISIKISVKCLFNTLAAYIHDLKIHGINEINIIDYGKNPKILGYLSGYMDNTIWI